jgi:hypothetical protein
MPTLGRIRMAFREVLTSLKAAYSQRSPHKAFQVLLREATIGLVPEEEGTASLVEVSDSSCTDQGQRSEVVKGQSPSLEQENDDGQRNTLRGCVPDRLMC